MKKLKLMFFSVMVMIVLAACGVDASTDQLNHYHADDIQIIYMDQGDISLMTNFEHLINTRSHAMRINVLNSHVERVENPQFMPTSAWIEMMIALEFPQEIIDRAQETYAYRRDIGFIPEPNPPIVRTIYQVEILEIFHEIEVFHDWQPTVGDIIEVTRIGGLYGREYWLSGLVDLEIGAEYILFLDRCWQYANRFDGSSLQGTYRVPTTLATDTSILDFDDIEFELELVGWANEFDVTIEDFIDLVNGELTSQRSRNRREVRRQRRERERVHEPIPNIPAHFGVHGMGDDYLMIGIVNHGDINVQTDLNFIIELQLDYDTWVQLEPVDKTLISTEIITIYAHDYVVTTLSTANLPPLELGSIYRVTMLAWHTDDHGEIYYSYEMQTMFWWSEPIWFGVDDD